MTSSKEEHRQRTLFGGPKLVVKTFRGALAIAIAKQEHAITHSIFPSPKYQQDPVAFFREVIGVDPWHRQREIIEAVRDNKRVTVKSGHKVSKSHTATGIALWFYCSFPDARVVMTSTTSRQVDDILWRELKMMRARSGVCVACKEVNKSRGPHDQILAPCEHSAIIDGEIGELARTGLKSFDFREIKGFTAREAEAVAGISAPNLLYILDEASGIREEIFEAIEGNRAGGARIVMFSNPTRTRGEFYDSHNSKSEFYSCHTISSEETPNVVYGDDDPRAIPGLASREWIEEKKKEWGVDSPMFKVRALGEFAELEEGKIFSLHDIAEAEERLAETPRDGRLFIGLDPAGDGENADESAWAIRRGQSLYDLIAMRGLTKEALLMHTLALCRKHQNKREIPVLVLDREGKVGAEVYGFFLAFLATKKEEPFQLIPVRASDRSPRNPTVYDRMRDFMAGNLLDWLREGGAIVSDTKLVQELHLFEWIEQERTGRVKITRKDEIRKELGRSPDRFDAVCLCVWEPNSVQGDTGSREDTIRDDDLDPNADAFDPYESAGSWYD